MNMDMDDMLKKITFNVEVKVVESRMFKLRLFVIKRILWVLSCIVPVTLVLNKEKG
jgi:hypothetical protein